MPQVHAGSARICRRCRIALAALGATLALASACRNGESFVDVGDRRLRDGSLPDGALDGTGTDSAAADAAIGAAIGATMDAAVLGLDAALNLPEGTLILPDGAILLPDGQIIDVDAALMRFERDRDLTSACPLEDDDDWQAPVDIEGASGFALVPGPTGFGLAYRSLGDASCAQNVSVAHLDASRGAPEPLQVLDECTAIGDVALAAAGGNWQLAWVDNLTRTAELHRAALGADMQPSGERQTLSDNDVRERDPVIAAIAGRPLLVWSTRAQGSGGAAIHARWLDGDAETVALVDESEQHAPNGLALGQVGAENAALGWVGPEDNPGVWLLALDAQGARSGAPVKLTERVAVSSSIGLATRSDGGAAVYSIEIDGEPQVRFRRLDQNGAPIADERVLIGPPLRAQDASIAALAGGYALVYRALPGAGIDAPQIRMTFVSKEGDVMRDAAGSVLSLKIAETSVASARTSVAVSVEGQLMVAWLDADPDGGSHSALHLTRRRLGCD